MNVIDSDAATIGARHVLGHGVSDVIAMVEPELTTLARTVAASAPMLQMITRLGAGLNGFNANAAPIAMPSGIRHLPDVPVEQSEPGHARDGPQAARGFRDSDGIRSFQTDCDIGSQRHRCIRQQMPRTEGSLASNSTGFAARRSDYTARGSAFDKTDGSSANWFGDRADNVIAGVASPVEATLRRRAMSNRHRAA